MNKNWFRKLFPRLQPAIATRTRALAEAGDREAQFALGMTYGSGPDGLRDLPRARAWLERAAGQEHVLAQFNLAQMYAGGQGGEPDPAAAEHWWRRAAAHGDPGAQYQLGLRCQRAGFQTDRPAATEARIEAFKWFELAADQGYGPAVSARETLNLSLDRAELAEARRRAAALGVEVAA